MVTFHPLTKQDIPLLEQAIEAEPYHRGWLKTAFFFHPASISVIASDDKGPILVLRMKPDRDVVAIFAQFICRDPQRSAKTIIEGFKTIKARLKMAGAKQIVMDSTSPALVRLCQQRLGFKALPEPDHYVLDLQDAHENEVRNYPRTLRLTR